jgi:hypothetical protein
VCCRPNRLFASYVAEDDEFVVQSSAET